MKSSLLFLLIFNFFITCFSQINGNPILQDNKSNAIAHISKEVIVQHRGQTLAQLLNEQPGIIVNGAYQPAGSLVNIYMEGTMGGHTLIMLDGLPIWDPSSIPDYFDINTFPLDIIEQIDIYHGAQSALAGNSAIAGVINIITKKNNLAKPFEFNASQSFGSLNTINTSLNISGQQNKWKYNASYSRNTSDGFSYAYDSTNKIGFDNDGFNNDIIKAQIEYAATKNDRFNAHCIYSRYKADTDADVFSDIDSYYYNDKQIITGIGYQHKNNKTLLVANYSYFHNTRNYHFDDFSYDVYNGESHFAELYFKSPVHKRILFAGGIDYKYGFMGNTFFDSNNGYGYHFYPSVIMASAYSSLMYLSKDSSLNIQIAGRIYHHSTTGNRFDYSIISNYNFSNNVSFNAGISTGSKSPCIFQLYNDYGFGNPNLVPEIITHYQIGLSYNNESIKQQIRCFYSDMNDIINVQSDVGIYTNFSKEKCWGLQYEIDWKINQHLKLSGNYAFVAGNDFTKDRTSFYDTVTYPYLIRRPEHMINLGIHYTHKPFKIGITAKYSGDFHDISNGFPEYTMPHFIVMNLYSSYNFNKHFQLFINAQNMLNNTFFDVMGYNSIPLIVNGGLNYTL